MFLFEIKSAPFSNARDMQILGFAAELTGINKQPREMLIFF